VKSNGNNVRGGLAALIGAVVLLSGWCAGADARSEYLIDMLANGGNYRVRVQAATTLGKIRSQEAVPALIKALGDENELVVISAATALGQIGDTRAIKPLEQAQPRAPSRAAAAQIATTLRVLRALTPEGDRTEVEAARARYLIRVDVMGNSSGVQRKDITDVMRKVVVKALQRQPGVVLQASKLKNNQVKAKLKKEKLKGYILSGSILKMEQIDDRMIVKISLNVFSNPEYNLLMMPSAEGAVPVMSGTLTREDEWAAQEQALKAVVEALLSNVFKALQNAD
jgi:hypothetical protein